eukprot:24425-Eustigmatos_ZCMA.PRE.1
MTRPSRHLATPPEYHHVCSSCVNITPVTFNLFTPAEKGPHFLHLLVSGGFVVRGWVRRPASRR